MKLHLDKSCRTCEFNFNGLCAGGEKYGSKIEDLNSVCEDWQINDEHYDLLLPICLGTLKINLGEIM